MNRHASSLESLEARQLLTATLVNGLLTIEGTRRADTILLSQYTPRGETAANIYYYHSATGVVDQKHYPASEVRQIVIHTGSGDDDVYFGLFVNSRISFPISSGGDARRITDITADVTVSTADGNDFVGIEAGADRIDLGIGNDGCRAGAGNDSVIGGSGDDTITGGGGNDTILGHSGADDLSGDADNDSISGGSSNDTLYGGDGRDSLFGDGEDDLIFGGNDSDLVGGGRGDDRIFGDAGTDRLFGNAGADRFFKNSDTRSELQDLTSQDLFV